MGGLRSGRRLADRAQRAATETSVDKETWQRRDAALFVPQLSDSEVKDNAKKLKNAWTLAAGLGKKPQSPGSESDISLRDGLPPFLDEAHEMSSQEGGIPHVSEREERQPTFLDIARINATFRRFQLDGFVHQDDMVDALRRLGFLHPRQEWIESAMRELTAYTTLSASEFVTFCSAYEGKVRASCLEHFQRYDTDDSGHLDRSEFAQLLQDEGIEPMEHVLEEVINEVDFDSSGCLDFEEFFEVMRLIQEREGFTRTEYVHFTDVFQTFDHDQTGEMDAQELMGVLSFLGYHCTPEDAVGVTHEVDFDGSGSLDQHEFLVCMRKLREREIQALKAAMLNNDVDMGGALGTGELQMLMHSVGYFPEEDIVKEVMEDIGEGAAIRAQSDGTFCLGKLWKFLVLFRSREGLCRKDCQEVDQAFNRYATGAEVSLTHLPKIIRYMGYMLSYDDQQRLVKQVDIDQSGALGLYELRKLIRICREQRAKLIYDAWVKHMDPNTEVVPQRAVGEVLHSLGCVKDVALKVPIPTDDPISVLNRGFSLKAFMKLARERFQELEREVQHNSGYSWKELEAMKAQFRLFDVDKSGEIRNCELVGLVKTVFPEMAVDQKLRPHLVEILREADADGNGSLDFEDFLRLMRTVYELRYRNQLEKEQQAVTDSTFSPQEVHEFREIFLHYVGHDKVLSLEEFKELIGDICPLGQKNCNLLGSIWREALHVYRCPAELEGIDDLEPSNHKYQVDFPEYLWVMKRILASNFGNVLQRTKRRASNQVHRVDSVPAAPPRVKHDLRPSIMYMLGGRRESGQLGDSEDRMSQDDGSGLGGIDEEDERRTASHEAAHSDQVSEGSR